MRERQQIISLLCDPGIIAVIRAKSAAHVLPICHALVSGGVTALEITLSTPNAIQAIGEARNQFGARALVGVGTVLDGETCEAALGAGAEFVVTPICRAEFVRLAHAANRPVMIGAYTPTEAQLAHEAGADFVKLFPADNLGPGYIRSLRAPLPHLRIVPTGGVELSNIADFLNAGCAAVGVGSSLLSSKVLETGDWPALKATASAFVAAARRARTHPG